MKYEITYVEPKVDVLSFIDNSQSFELWIKSRRNIVEIDKDNQKLKVGTEEFIGEDELNDYVTRITKMGLQYTNFPNITFEITGSILFRDILFQLNKCPQWATSLRFVNSTIDDFNSKNYPVSNEYRDIPNWVNQFNLYMDKIQETMVTDENRIEMPYSVSSRYWIQMNWKTLVGFLSMLKLKMPFFYEVYGKLMIEKVNEIYKVNFEDFLVNYIDASIEQYFYSDETSNKIKNLSDDELESVNYIDDTVIVRQNMGLLLYSQFIRQQDCIIKGLYNELVHTDISEFMNKVFSSKTKLVIIYIADKSRFNRTLSNRSCWFSMSSGNDINSWSRFLDISIKDMNEDQLWSLLPCSVKNGCISCKYYDDVKFRKEGIEKRNLPCGILYMNEDYIDERNNYDKTNLSKGYKLVFNKLKSEGVKGVE